ncbi:hypothetical protein CN97_16000 [Haematobacter massiliensis]|uniref:Uncharacterized protein n=1 Tax=Haematobacter massiliensis TaxID=195105 RepID=A0A086Y574_9RHOB|nr:hypothetical protein [Haematobacter massiliensis]KFI29424.1 hypothetical protein CN97_16000 [Haematobacter massiliensis]OWJ83993.1 hypothetical protein CDV51_14530 [Haematobacter massiliensis]
MITNLPTHESLTEAALKAYFRAWEDLLAIWSDFDGYYESSEYPVISSEWQQEWDEYLVQCQSDLQAITSLLQQSMELGLKARICAVSPYLLLLDSGLKLSSKGGSIDYSELRTLDAVDLPGAVNTLASTPVSDAFITEYTQTRVLRNKIIHQGGTSVTLHPKAVFQKAIKIYRLLWNDRLWLQDRVTFAMQTRIGFLHDGKYTSAHMIVFHEIPTVMALLSKSEFKTLFKQEKSKRRYLCLSCLDAGNTRYADIDIEKVGTAYLAPDGSVVHCLMCDQVYKIKRVPCTQNCKGDVMGANDDDWSEHCHTCGQLNEDPKESGKPLISVVQ